MRTFTEDEKRTIATTVQGAFLAVHGKRYHCCWWESLAMEQILRLLDPEGKEAYQSRWSLTWFITDRPPGNGEARFDFEERYRSGCRIPFRNEVRQRMAHAYVYVKGDHTQVIDISTDYTSDVLKSSLHIKWPFKLNYIWKTYDSLPEDLRWWYAAYDQSKLRDLDHQAPPDGLISRVEEEAWTRLTAQGLGPVT